jgi:hypothetical protein
MILATFRESYHKQRKTGRGKTGLTKGQRNLLAVVIVMKRTVEALALIATGALFVGILIKSMPLVRLIGFLGMFAIILSAFVTVYLAYRLKKQLGYDICFKNANRGR